MKFELKMDKEQLKVIGNAGLRIGKAIVVEGTKALVVKTAVKAINTGFEGGKDGLKNLTLDDVVGKKEKKDKTKKKWFSKKKDEVEELIEEVTEDANIVDIDTTDEVEEVEYVEAELVD